MTTKRRTTKKKSSKAKRSAKPTRNTVKKRRTLKSQSKRSAAKKKTSKSASASRPTAMRLTFSYQGNQVKLVSQEPVDMIVPPSDPVQGYDEQKGFWAEVKSRKNATLFRRVMHNPTRNDAEVFPDDSEQTISRQPAPNRKGVFVVVVPHTDDGHEVTLSRSTAQLSQPVAGMHRPARLRSLAAAPAKEFARFKLKK